MGHPPTDPAVVYRYHDGTKHHFHRYAQSLGYLDWASQPKPFRSFSGAESLPLYPVPGVEAHGTGPAIGDVLRHALGLSAWKQHRASRWSLRVNPSSGNLHPTEAYIIAGPRTGLCSSPSVFHYAPDRHALERRCVFDDRQRLVEDVWLVALTSIHWREAWKYGERAFRYCQHDLGHAIAALRIAAGLLGWAARLLPQFSTADLAALTGVDRDGDFVEAEREEPACVLAVGLEPAAARLADNRAELVAAVRGGVWTGRASQLSEDHVQWSFIDEIAEATFSHARGAPPPRAVAPRLRSSQRPQALSTPYDRRVILQRRSAVAFDGSSGTSRERFLHILERARPGPRAPWDALWWSPRIHFALFVHRVEGIEPGLYFLARDVSVIDRARAAMHREFLWTPVHDNALFCLARGDCRALSARLSCDQDIASDGFFSLGMIADFSASLQEFGAPFYRELFWEAGAAGQVLYLEAEAAGARATGIGCFFDDPVHDLLGLAGHTFQSLYHFTIGMPVDDTRLTTEPGYAWEKPIV